MNWWRWIITIWSYLLTAFLVSLTFAIKDMQATKLGIWEGYTYGIGTVNMPSGYAHDDEGNPIIEYKFISVEKTSKE